MKTKVKNAVAFMLRIANDNAHGYDQIYRWGERGDYDCSSLIITAFEQAGIPLKSKGATYTGNMKSAALKCGFKDVTKQVTLSTGKGIMPGDILLNEAHHVALAITDNGATICHASINEKGKATGGTPGDQTGKEICTRSYYNKPWNCILRYDGEDNYIVVSACDATGIAGVGDYLNCRKEPSIASEVVAAFAPGDKIYITGIASNNWYRCKIWDGSEAYVYGDYVYALKKNLTNGTTAVTGTGKAAVNSYLNCRAKPSEDAEIVGAFRPNDVIYITGKLDGWYRCKIWDGSEAYVSSKYVSDLSLN